VAFLFADRLLEGIVCGKFLCQRVAEINFFTMTLTAEIPSISWQDIGTTFSAIAAFITATTAAIKAFGKRKSRKRKRRR
jgi:hypothetical protein